MRLFLVAFFLFLLENHLFGQNTSPDDYGFRSFKTIFKGDTVNLLVKSKKGDELVKKPLFIFCQGSLPIPLIIEYDEKGKKGIYNVFPFNTDSICNRYHLVIISKPFIPVIANEKSLNSDFTYFDKTGNYPLKYSQRNLPDYYTDRDIAVIQFLQNQYWVSKSKLIIAGHSEGSTIAAMIASKFLPVTHLIYVSGNPLGRYLSVIEQQRSFENDTTQYAEKSFDVWKNIVEDRTNTNAGKGDSYKTTYDFSIPPMKILEKLHIPVLICYGTKDYNSPFNDYFRMEMIRQKRKNFEFKSYIGLDHNFFPKNQYGETNYEIYNWDKVAKDWLMWLK